MAREFGRSQRVGDYLKRELAGMIQTRLRDPRLGMVSVTDVKVSRDIGYADVYVTFLNRETERDAKEPIDVLNKAAGYLRSLLAKDAQMRTTPKLRFKFDTSVRRGNLLSELIDKAVESDQRSNGTGKE